jgi:hypothetical protein
MPPQDLVLILVLEGRMDCDCPLDPACPGSLHCESDTGAPRGLRPRGAPQSSGQVLLDHLTLGTWKTSHGRSGGFLEGNQEVWFSGRRGAQPSTVRNGASARISAHPLCFFTIINKLVIRYSLKSIRSLPICRCFHCRERCGQNGPRVGNWSHRWHQSPWIRSIESRRKRILVTCAEIFL